MNTQKIINFVVRPYVFIWTHIRQYRIVRWLLFWRNFYQMRRRNVPVLTLRMARRMGIHNIYHLNKGVGDGLMFAGVAREYFKQTGIRPLIFMPQWHILQHCDFCYLLYDWRFLTENVPNTKHSMDVFYNFYARQVNGMPLTLHRNYKFNLIPLEYLKNISPCNTNLIKLFNGFPMRGQIVQRIANCMGITGEIDTRPEIKLTEFEKEFGKFARGKIVIKCGGSTMYKYLTAKIAQDIIDKMHHEYDFLQIGDFKDPILYGTENLFKLNLREMAGVLYNARLYIGPIGGMMHLARAVNCPAVILHGCEHDDFYYPSQRKIFSETRCLRCAHKCWWPDTQDERRCDNRYKCITDFDTDRVVNIIRQELKRPRETAATPDIFKCIGRTAYCNSMTSWWLSEEDYIMDFCSPCPSDNRRINALCTLCDYTTTNKRPSDEYSIYTTKPTLFPANWQLLNIPTTHFDRIIYADNPIVFNFKPRPSYFAYIAKIADLQHQWTTQWHKTPPFDDSAHWINTCIPQAQYATFEGLVRTNHMLNYFLWHEQEKSRQPGLSNSAVADIKRHINELNDQRHRLIEKIDATIIMIMEPDLPHAFQAPLNTESLGMIIDRLSILALKIYHAKHIDKSPQKNSKKQNTDVFAILDAQWRDLMESTKCVIVDYLSGARRPKAYKQLKIYHYSSGNE